MTPSLLTACASARNGTGSGLILPFGDDLDVAALDSNSFQTPDYAVSPLVPYLPPGACIWEPACGQGNIVRYLTSRGFHCHGTDILTGGDFLTCEPPDGFDVIVTNPPYSTDLLLGFIRRCMAYGRPWALLVPLYCLGNCFREQCYRQANAGVLMLGDRVRFTTPTGRAGKASSPQFEVCWVGAGLGFDGRHIWGEMPDDPYSKSRSLAQEAMPI